VKNAEGIVKPVFQKGPGGLRKRPPSERTPSDPKANATKERAQCDGEKEGTFVALGRLGEKKDRGAPRGHG